MTVVQTSTNRWDLDMGEQVCTVWAPTDRSPKWASAFKAKVRSNSMSNGYMSAPTAREALQLFAPFRGVRAQFKRALP